MSILLAQPWPLDPEQHAHASASAADLAPLAPQPIQLIELTPWTPPPPRIQPSRHFPPSHRRIVRTPSLSTITDRRESGTSFDVSTIPSSSASSSSSVRSIYHHHEQHPSRPRRMSSDSSGSTLSSESQQTQSSDIHPPPLVQIHQPSPDHSLASLRRSTSLPRLSPPQPIASDPLTFPPDPAHIITPRLRKLDPIPESDFSPVKPPSQEQLQHASSLPIIAQDGRSIPFGSLFADQKTIVCFIRHFWCPMCQDYMYHCMRNVDPAALERAGVRLVIISHGSPAMIRSYRQIFRMPDSIPLFTDPTRNLYRALGMTVRTLEAGPESEKGPYVRHGQVSGTVMVVKNAIKVRMPITAKGGDVKQLGGEFILGPGLQCSYVSRMSTTRNHTSLTVLLDHAGVERPSSPQPFPTLNSTSTTLVDDDWERSRKAELRGICDRRLNRRGGFEHLRWVGDCGLYERDSSVAPTEGSATPSSSRDTEPEQLRAAHSDQLLSEAYRTHNSDRVRTISDPGPALVADWLAAVAVPVPPRAALDAAPQ